MKRSKDPFEAAIDDEQEESPPESSVGGGGAIEIEQTREEEEEEERALLRQMKKRKTSSIVAEAKKKDERAHHPVKKMRAILSQFIEEQTNRYGSFRRSTFPKLRMNKLLQCITGMKIGEDDNPMNVVVCGIAKMFVGELVETARVVMVKRKETGPIRPSHVIESYRRLKLQGKVPRRSVPRLFR